MRNNIAVQEADFDVAIEYAKLVENDVSNGAAVMFCGLVRDVNQGKQVKGLYLEHYPAMTNKVLANLVEQARGRWDLGNVSIIHRVGQLSLADQIVFVGVTSVHRQAAFEACNYLMDTLKTQAPFWKKEQSNDEEYWVEARQTDLQASQKWLK